LDATVTWEGKGLTDAKVSFLKAVGTAGLAFKSSRVQKESGINIVDDLSLTTLLCGIGCWDNESETQEEY
jgi:hypothetical protein